MNMTIMVMVMERGGNTLLQTCKSPMLSLQKLKPFLQRLKPFLQKLMLFLPDLIAASEPRPPHSHSSLSLTHLPPKGG